MAGKTAVSVKTAKLRGKAIIRGGAGTAARTIGLLGDILTYAVEAGIIETNPAFGIRKPKDNVRDRRLSEAEYRLIGTKLRDAEADGQYAIAAQIIRLLALTGCRRSELTKLRWNEVDIEGSCLRLEDSKEGKSVRPVGLHVVECLQQQDMSDDQTYVLAATMPTAPFPIIGRRYSADAVSTTSRLMCCGIVSPASRMISASPKPRSRRCWDMPRGQ